MSYNDYGEVTRNKGISLFAFPDNYIILDIETTGLSPQYCEIIELAAIKVKDGQIDCNFNSLIKPSSEIPEFIQNLTGITNSMVDNAPSIAEILPSFLEFIGRDILVGHNIPFDINFIAKAAFDITGETIHNDYIDTARIAKKLLYNLDNHKLSTIASYFDIQQENAHRALDDCYTTNEIFQKLKNENANKEASFISLFENIETVLKDKLVVFKGSTSICSYDAYERICTKAGGRTDTVFYNTADYIVFGNHTYKKFAKGDYSEKMLKALELQNNGSLKILSESQFISLFGIDIPEEYLPKKRNKNIDIKSLSAQTDDFDETHPLYGKLCVFTGTLDRMPRQEAMQAVLNFGGEIGNGVTKKTNYLILGCNDFCSAIKDGKSSKHKKAEELKLKGCDIEIISEDVFYSMLNE